MPDEETGGVGGFLRRLQRKTTEVLAEQQAGLARGRVAGTTVLDAEGNPIVQAGDRIDDAAIEHASRAGKLAGLAASAAAAVGQDLREKAGEVLASTPDGQENRELDSVVEYARARRRLVGRRTGIDVTDIRGAVIVPAGSKISEADVRAARAAGQLGALEHAANQPYVPDTAGSEAPRGAPGEADAPPEEPPARRSTLPIVKPPDDP